LPSTNPPILIIPPKLFQKKKGEGEKKKKKQRGEGKEDILISNCHSPFAKRRLKQRGEKKKGTLRKKKKKIPRSPFISPTGRKEVKEKGGKEGAPPKTLIYRFGDLELFEERGKKRGSRPEQVSPLHTVFRPHPISQRGEKEKKKKNKKRKKEKGRGKHANLTFALGPNLKGRGK